MLPVSGSLGVDRPLALPQVARPMLPAFPHLPHLCPSPTTAPPLPTHACLPTLHTACLQATLHYLPFRVGTHGLHTIGQGHTCSIYQFFLVAFHAGPSLGISCDLVSPWSDSYACLTHTGASAFDGPHTQPHAWLVYTAAVELGLPRILAEWVPHTPAHILQYVVLSFALCTTSVNRRLPAFL